ncbi:hypothetical protein COU53_00600 [Candidatus Pacearchaeota archaeon CG10_big_fil_rev_8_21_14_0_10_30_48]|nr:MAG: hypothetical protein COU53_00600 [Candidatus Pacearchaeota archaeon CG10_big_fil_rev_8_21_14_0_10_30_48]
MKRREFLKGLVMSGLYSDLIFDKQDFHDQIYLTIDDGPSKYTDPIVEELGNQKAIFYIVGSRAINDKGFSSICNVLENNHLIANHSYNHPNFSEISLDTAKEEISKTDDIINEAHEKTGVQRTHKLFRFPYGLVKNSVLPFLEEKGYGPIGSWEKSYLDWNIDTQDWMHYSSTSYKTEEQIMENCRKTKQGNIVLCHEKSITLEKIIPYYLENNELILLKPNSLV